MCWVSMRSLGICLAALGTASAIDADSIGAVAIGSMRRLGRHSIAMGAAHNELQWGNFYGRIFGSTTCIFFREVENLVKGLLPCHGGKSTEAEVHVAQQRGPKPPPGGTRSASGCTQPHH